MLIMSKFVMCSFVEEMSLPLLGGHKMIRNAFNTTTYRFQTGLGHSFPDG